LRLAGGASCADCARGRCPLDSRNFFEKKLSKSFLSPAGGMGAPSFAAALLTIPPKGRRDGRPFAQVPCGFSGLLYHVRADAASRIYLTVTAFSFLRRDDRMFPEFPDKIFPR